MAFRALTNPMVVTFKLVHRVRSLHIFDRSLGTHLVWGGGDIPEVWAMAEKAFFLGPASWDSLIDRIYNIQYLPA